MDASIEIIQSVDYNGYSIGQEILFNCFPNKRICHLAKKRHADLKVCKFSSWSFRSLSSHFLCWNAHLRLERSSQSQNNLGAPFSILALTEEQPNMASKLVGLIHLLFTLYLNFTPALPSQSFQHTPSYSSLNNVQQCWL